MPGHFFSENLLEKDICFPVFPRIRPGKEAWAERFVRLFRTYIIYRLFHSFSLHTWLIIAGIILVFGTFGDLIKSLMKRSLHIKDTGSLASRAWWHSGQVRYFTGFITIYIYLPHSDRKCVAGSYYIVNGLTLYRLFSAPILVLFALLRQPETFKWLLALSFLTDGIDGTLARRYKVSSEYGSRLDSIADDLTIVAGLVGMAVFKPDLISNALIPFLILFLLIYFTNDSCFGALPETYKFSYIRS